MIYRIPRSKTCKFECMHKYFYLWNCIWQWILHPMAMVIHTTVFWRSQLCVLTYCGLMSSYCDIDLAQVMACFLTTPSHITWTNAHLLSMGFRTSLTIVYSNVYLDADQRKHQSSASLAFVWGIHRGPVNSPHKWPVTRKMFPFDDVIMMSTCWQGHAFHITSHLWGDPPVTDWFLSQRARHTEL